MTAMVEVSSTITARAKIAHEAANASKNAFSTATKGQLAVAFHSILF